MAKRSRTRERKKERQQERQRNQQMVIAAAIVVVVLFIASAFFLTSVPAEAPIPDTISRYEDLRKGFTDEEGYPRLGSPNAPVTLMEFSSFACPACLAFEQNVFKDLIPRIARGEIQFIFVPLTTGSVQNPDGANRTALCAGEQGKFWEMHDTLFSWHEIFGPNAFQDNRLRSGVDALGLDMDAFNRCFRSEKTNTVLNAAQGEGVTSTPTLRIDGAELDDNTLETINAAIDSKGPFTDLEPGTISGLQALQEAEAEEAPLEDEEIEATAEATSDVEATLEADATAESDEMMEDATAESSTDEMSEEATAEASD